MKRLMALVAMFLVGVVLTAEVRADDAEDVKAAYVRHITLSRTGQIDPLRGTTPSGSHRLWSQRRTPDPQRFS